MLAKKKFELRKDKEKGDAGKETPSEPGHTATVVTEEAAEVPLLLPRERADNPKVARLIPIDRIRTNPHQKRVYFAEEKIQELANGMKEHGWIGGGLPVRNDPHQTHVYQLVWGERRLRAAKLAGLTAIPCEISPYTDDDMTELGLLENVQRENLTNYELGIAYKSLLELQVNGKPKYSIRTLAKRLGFNDKSAVERMLVYARAPEDVQELAKAKPDVAPRIVHELIHMKEEDRAPVIAAVLAGGTDIEDVRAVRKQLQTTEKQVSERGAPEVIEEAPDEAIAVKKLSPAMSPMQAERALVERRMKRDNRRILEILTGWSDARGSLDEPAKSALLNYLTTWETTIVQFKQLLQQDDQEISG